ncbi:uncharacterized protein LOC142346272 [Convolutriloba macropyga]|uniref:uncharacterized protein LOC142346272 n=1 Tax=Convolutriloba macropyga TaxID=536237 RepID=UPI003F526603
MVEDFPESAHQLDEFTEVSVLSSSSSQFLVPQTVQYKVPSTKLNSPGSMTLDSLLEEETKAIEELEGTVTSQESAMSTFDALFSDIQGDFDVFDSSEMWMEDVDEKSTDTAKIFGEDMAILYKDSTDFFQENTQQSVEELQNMMDSFQEMSDKLNDDVWSNWDDKFKNMAQSGAKSAKSTADNNQERVDEIIKEVNKKTEQVFNAAKDTFWNRWRRSSSVQLQTDDTSKQLCQDYQNKGEFEFCEKYKDEEACEAICGSESSLFCSEAYEETQKLQQKIEKLKDLTAKHDKVALEAVREHGWAKIFLLTCRLKYEHKDAKGILIDSITTDPLDYNAQEPWLFNNVKVVFSLNQKKVDKDDEKYVIKDARVVVSKPSNLLNVYDPNSVQPFASAVVDELNRKYQEVHF